MKRLAKNFLNVLSGDITASVLSLLSLSFITKSIGMEKYGFIILIQGIAALIDGLFNFQSWQGIIKFFPEVKNDKASLKKLIKFSYVLDFSTALLAFTILISISSWLGKFYSFNSEEIFLLILFSCYIPFNIQGTPIGILRSFDRFDFLRNQRILTAIFNFTLCVIGYFFQLKTFYFISVFIFFNISGAILLNFYTLKILKKHSLLDFLFQKNYFNKKFFIFTLYTNINSSLDIPIHYFDTLLIGKYLSLEQVGIYKVLKTIANILDRIGTPIYQILYPYFCENVTQKINFKEIFQKFFKISLLLCGGCITMFVILNTFGFSLLSIFFQKVILNYKLEVNFYLLIKSIGISLVGIHPLFLALGFIKKETFIILFSNFIYVLILFPLIQFYGLIGVITAYGIQVLLILSLKSFFILRKKRSVSEILLS
jgi:O-antigen/teichoic acid export membrane protein